MSLRTRIFLASLLVTVLPFALLAVGIRREMSDRLETLYSDRVEGLALLVGHDLESRSARVGAQLRRVAQAMANDNELRLSLAGAGDDRYRVDYAEQAMRLTGLSMFQLHDASGRIVSSGRYRNDYGRVDPMVPRLLLELAGSLTVLEARDPERNIEVLASCFETSLGGKSYFLVGGEEVDPADWLAGGMKDVEIRMRKRSDPASESEASWIVRELAVFFLVDGADRGDPAAIEIRHSSQPLDELLSGLDLWLLGFPIALAIGSLVLAHLVAGRISHPLQQLADKTTRVHLRHAHPDFRSSRRDEIGDLSRFIGRMVDRLDSSVTQLQEAERHATLGEMARQVNHDLKNGFMPIRNVVRHLSELAESDPEQLAQVFKDRRGTLESGLGYLEELASNYARLSPRSGREPVDLNEVIRQVETASSPKDRERIEIHLDTRLPRIEGDALGLRRVVENLVRNAIDSLAGTGTGAGRGTGRPVTIRTVALDTEDIPSGPDRQRSVLLEVSDRGEGMDESVKSQVFEHFFTTKKSGTGLGLSIVRRLVSDFDGKVELESAPGAGTTFRIRFPAITEENR